MYNVSRVPQSHMVTLGVMTLGDSETIDIDAILPTNPSVCGLVNKIHATKANYLQLKLSDQPSVQDSGQKDKSYF